jgi:hypothetical protein
MPRRLNSCPIDNQQIEFFGISRKNTGTYALNEDGEEVPVIERFHWSRCTFDERHMIQANFNGKIIAVRPPFGKDELKSLFPTSREA